jgi:hypothetical protein
VGVGRVSAARFNSLRPAPVRTAGLGTARWARLERPRTALSFEAKAFGRRTVEVICVKRPDWALLKVAKWVSRARATAAEDRRCARSCDRLTPSSRGGSAHGPSAALPSPWAQTGRSRP